MASIYALKGRFQSLLRPVVRRLHAAGATANQVTAGTALASLGTAAAVFLLAPADPHWFLLLPLWMLVRMALNAIDGMLAREFGQQSRLGAYLNELCDVIADAALYLALLAVAGISAPAVWTFALAAAIAEYAGVLGPMVGASRRYDGPMGKSDRAFVVGALGLLLALGLIDGRITNGVLWIAAALAFATAINRVRAALRHADATPRENA